VFTIVGGGFGLYGYLPAILSDSKDGVVLLAERYRKVIDSRPELNRYSERIVWCSSIPDALSKASGAVIAIPPTAQQALVYDLLSIRKLKKLIIEKPLCPQPSDSVSLISALLADSKCFRVGYTFLYTNWCRELESNLKQPAARVQINWSFKADHFLKNKDTWKRYHSLGGGVIRFYGIQLLAVLASLGYSAVVFSKLFARLPDQPDAWAAQFSGENIPLCDVFVATHADENYIQIIVNESPEVVRFFYNDASPFIKTLSAEDQDNRIPILEKLLNSMNHNENRYLRIYHATNELWKLTEKFHEDP